MKNNLHKQTKYFRKIYNRDLLKFELEEIPLNRNNWFYVQIDATIRTSFLKYNLPLPKYGIFEESKHYITINLIRDNVIKNEKKLFDWITNIEYVRSELAHQALCNSTDIEDVENWVKYEFNII